MAVAGLPVLIFPTRRRNLVPLRVAIPRARPGRTSPGGAAVLMDPGTPQPAAITGRAADGRLVRGGPEMTKFVIIRDDASVDEIEAALTVVRAKQRRACIPSTAVEIGQDINELLDMRAVAKLVLPGTLPGGKSHSSP